MFWEFKLSAPSLSKLFHPRPDGSLITPTTEINLNPKTDQLTHYFKADRLLLHPRNSNSSLQNPWNWLEFPHTPQPSEDFPPTALKLADISSQPPQTDQDSSAPLKLTGISSQIPKWQEYPSSPRNLGNLTPPKLTGTSSCPKPDKSVFGPEPYRDLLIRKAAESPQARAAQSYLTASGQARSGAAQRLSQREARPAVPAPQAARAELWDRHGNAANLARLTLEPPAGSRWPPGGASGQLSPQLCLGPGR